MPCPRTRTAEIGETLGVEVFDAVRTVLATRQFRTDPVPEEVNGSARLPHLGGQGPRLPSPQAAQEGGRVPRRVVVGLG